MDTIWASQKGSRLFHVWRGAAWLTFFVLLGFGSYHVAKHIYIERKAEASVPAVPFLLEIHSYSFDSNPQGELFHKKLVARRSDGSTAVLSSVGPLSWGRTVRKLTLLSGERVTVFDLIAAKTSLQLRRSELAALKSRLLAPPPNCLLYEDAKYLGEEVILNHRVVVVEQIAGEERTTRWMALDLGCEPFGFRLEMLQPDGSYKIRSQNKALAFQLGEPDPSLFDARSDYEELKPSDGISRYFSKLGLPVDEDSQRTGLRLDRKYSEQHKKTPQP